LVGGTETYARGLLEGLDAAAPEHHFTVFLNEGARNWPLPSRFARVVCPASPRQSARYLYEQLRLPAQLKRREIGLVHSLAYVAPVFTRCASVVTVHDLNYRAPSHRMPLLRRLTLRTFVSAAVRTCDAVIAVSRFTRDEIAAAMPASSAKLHVVHEAPAIRSSEAAAQTPRAPEAPPYFLAFSSVSPNKNIGRLIQAHAEARAGGVPHRLVLVGHPPPWEVGDSPGIVWTGYVAEAEVDRLLRGATGLLFPSLYEGFGLPVLEAMRARVPVACSRSGALPEIAGDAALYFHAEETSSIAEAIRRLAVDEAMRKELVERGDARVAGFSWRRAAEETLAVYESALVSRDGSSRATS
jgi:glycosyltransferase involved in cell wall biosynthesis